MSAEPTTPTVTPTTTRILLSLTPAELTALRSHPSYKPFAPGTRSGDGGTIHAILMQALGRESVDRRTLTHDQRADNATIEKLKKEGWVK